MIKPGWLKDEKKRFQALHELGILDSDTEERFDRLTRLAANYFNVKICLVSLVDADRQWFKSKFGLDASETERDISFCGHAILQTDIMLVSDARKDERFADNPLVVGEPHVVFYAGAPLKTVDGYKIGTLCLIDDKPRTLDSLQLNALRDFADMAEQEINDLYQKQLQHERQQALARMQRMLDVFPDIVLIIQKDLRYVAANEHQDLYLAREQFLGRTIHDVLPPDIAALYEHSLKRAFKTGDLISFHYQLQIGDTPNLFEARARAISETEVVVVVRNTTEKHARITELERLSMVAQQTTNGVVITDRDKKVVWINDAFTKISGYSLEEMIGKIPGELLQGPETNPDTVQKMHDDLNQGKSFSVDVINYHKNGRPYWMRIICNPYHDNSGNTKGFIAIQSDITREVEYIEQIQHNQKLLTAVIDANSIGTWSLNLQTRTLIINENWANLLGYTLRELEPVNMDTWQNLTHPEDVQKCIKMLEDYDKGLIDYYEARIRMKHKDGHWVWIRTTGNITSRTDDGKAEFMLGTHLDINAQMLAEEDLQEQYEYSQVIFDNMIDGIVIMDTQDKIQSFNSSAEVIFGYSSKEVSNQNISLLIPEIHKTHFDGQLQYSEGKRKNGEIFPMEIGVVKSKNKHETIFVGMLRDVTERKSAEQAIHNLAYYDGLTGLPNRRLMFDRLEHALLKSKRYKTQVAVLFVDIDNFKQINDSAGHEAGDLLLQRISVRLRNSVRESDTVARMGGDEFIIILEDLNANFDRALSQARFAAQKIKAQINKPYLLRESSFISACSIGIALCHEPLLSTSEFLKHADLAMYEAKLAGKNAIRSFVSEMQDKANSRIEVEQDLLNASLNDEFEIYYQTQVDSEGFCIGAEGLLRWNHPQRGLISPMEFIPIAEESGLIVSIGRWVIKQACLRLVRWADEPTMSDMVLAVNVSVVELNQEDWAESILQTIDETGANPAKLKLEVTESVMAFDIEKVITKLSKLRDKGVYISLDDFGTGYSSLSYLKVLPLNQLKIDKSFVKDILTNPDDKALAETIIGLANMMELDVLAEGVETEEQLTMLKGMGCHAFQGYLFGKPEMLEHFEPSCVFRARAS